MMLKRLRSIFLSLIFASVLFIFDEYIGYPWDELLKAVLMIGIIVVLNWQQKILMVIASLATGYFLWFVSSYIPHPFDYTLNALWLIIIVCFSLMRKAQNKEA